MLGGSGESPTVTWELDSTTRLLRFTTPEQYVNYCTEQILRDRGDQQTLPMNPTTVASISLSSCIIKPEIPA